MEGRRREVEGNYSHTVSPNETAIGWLHSDPTKLFIIYIFPLHNEPLKRLPFPCKSVCGILVLHLAQLLKQRGNYS